LGCGLRALDEALRQAELGAEKKFTAGHLASVGFVVMAGEMKEAVEDENFDLRRERVMLLDGLLSSGGDRDSQIANDLFCAYAPGGKGAFSWK